MTRLFIFTMIVKAAILAMGILAWYGHEWAFGIFLIVSIMAILADVLLAVVSSAENDIERGDM